MLRHKRQKSSDPCDDVSCTAEDVPGDHVLAGAQQPREHHQVSFYKSATTSHSGWLVSPEPTSHDAVSSYRPLTAATAPAGS